MTDEILTLTAKFAASGTPLRHALSRAQDTIDRERRFAFVRAACDAQERVEKVIERAIQGGGDALVLLREELER